MALQRATRTGGDYLDLKELAADGPVVVVFKIREFLPGERRDFGMAYDVVADVLICTGPRAGEVVLGEKFIGAITNTLRGVTAKQTAEEGKQPVNGPGDEIVSRVEVIKKGKNPAYAGGEVPSDAEFDAAAKVHADGAGWNATPPAQEQPAAAMAGATSGGGKPWDD